MFIIWKTTLTIFYRSLSTKITKSVEKHKFLYPVGSGNEEWVKQLTSHCVHVHGKMVFNVGLSSSPLSSFVVSWALRHRAMSRNNVSTMRLTVCLHFWCTLPALSETLRTKMYHPVCGWPYLVKVYVFHCWHIPSLSRVLLDGQRTKRRRGWQYICNKHALYCTVGNLYCWFHEAAFELYL